MIVPVKKISFITLINDESFLLEGLGKLGVVQLKKLDDTEIIGFEKFSVEEIREYDGIYERLRGLLDRISSANISILNTEHENVFEEKLIENPREFEKRVNEIEIQISEALDRLSELEKVKPILQELRKQEKKPKDLGEFKNIFTKAGILNKRYLPRIERMTRNRKDLTYKSSQISENEIFLYISGLLEIRPFIDKALEVFGFNEFKLPKDMPGEFDDAAVWVEEEKINAESNIHELCDEIIDLEKTARYSLSVITSKSNLLRSKTMSAFQGWVPKDRIPELEVFFDRTIKKVKGRLIFWFDEPDPDEEMPSVMKNPRLFQAYEVLTRQYGYPNSREMDPTPISTILWITMFGLMFPDFGHGIFILGLGASFAYVLKRNMMGINMIKIGKLMIGLGISAIIFGLLLGEFFMTEVTPLWPGLEPGWVMDPLNVMWIIKIAIFFGIAQIILAMSLSIFNHIRNGETLEALLSEHGVAGLITFIGIVIVAFEFLGISIVPGIRFPRLELGVFSHWTFIIPVAGICAVFAKPIITGEGITIGFGIILETLISFLANMLSYARIAGFCIAHAALALVVHNLLQVNLALGIGLGLIFLNAFALTLELLVAMIQALRLLYYEFKTKFFEGTGTSFSPYKL
jgi:V/A-type H+-transporting ATPase subunit I